MKTLSLVSKSVKEQVREPLMLGVTVTFGAVFMAIFGLAFGEGYSTYRVAIENLDADGPAGVELVERLEAMTYDDGARLFIVERSASLEGLKERLQRRDLYAAVSIPAGFSRALRGAGPPVTLSVKGDPANTGFGLVRMMLQSALDDVLTERGGAAPPAALETTFIETNVKGGGEFTYLAPGLMLMAIFLLLIQCSMVIVREAQSGTMLRLRLSRMRVWEFLLGVSLSQVLFAAAMLPLMYGMARLVGFQGTGELGTAFLVGLFASGTAVAFGLVNAAISRTVVQAFLWGNLMTVPVVFLSGAFFPIPERVLFSVGGYAVNLMDWLPSSPAVTAMNKVLIYGAGLGEVAPELFKMTLMSALLFAFGVALFSRTHLRRL